MKKDKFKIGQKLFFIVSGMRLEGTYLDDAFFYTKDKNSDVVNIMVTLDESNISPIGTTTRVSLSFLKKI